MWPNFGPLVSGRVLKLALLVFCCKLHSVDYFNFLLRAVTMVGGHPTFLSFLGPITHSKLVRGTEKGKVVPDILRRTTFYYAI